MKFANENEGFIPHIKGYRQIGKALGFDPSKRKRLQVRVLLPLLVRYLKIFDKLKIICYNVYRKLKMN